MTTRAFVWSGSISQNADANTSYTLGLRFELLTGNTLDCVGVRYRIPATLSSTPGVTVGLWRFGDQALLASKAYATQPGDAGLEVDVLFDTPVTLDDGGTNEYVVGVLTTGTGGTVRYPTIGSYPVPVTQDPLFAGLAAFRFVVGASLTFPTSGTAANFLVSPILDTGGPVDVTLTPAVLTFTAVPLTATPGPITVALTPAEATLTAQPLTATPGAVTVALTPAVITFTAMPVLSAIETGTLTAGATASTLTASTATPVTLTASTVP